MRINKFGGLIAAASPYVIPAGGAVEQVNVMSLVPGQLTVRGGTKRLASGKDRYLELWGYSVGSGKTDSILGFTERGSIVQIDGVGSSSTTQTVKDATSFDSQHPVCFSQGRRGEVYIYQGYGKRGMVRSPAGNIRPVGLFPPTEKPAITLDKKVDYYVARIDIIEAGNGYRIPPTVSIGPSKGRQAKAISRINGGQVSEIEVTDGGSKYATTPIVKIIDPPDQPATGKGAEASIALQDGCARGDYKTGVVYWEVENAVSGGFAFYQCSGQKWKNGFIVPAQGGSGTGASMYLELTDYGKRYFGITQGSGTTSPEGVPGGCKVIPPPGEEQAQVDDLIQSFQVFDFGSGYKPGDNVWCHLKVANSLTWSSGNLVTNCSNYSQACPVVMKGYVWNSEGCPDAETCRQASPARSTPLQTTVKSGGYGYLIPPSFVTTDGEVIKTEINDQGSVVKLIVQNPFRKYLFPPELLDEDGDVGKALAMAIMRPVFRGKYQCYYRYVNDDVQKIDGGPIYSSLSPVTEIDAEDGASVLTWKPIDIPEGSNAIELWRSTSDQATTLFRVAKFGGKDPFGSWVDALSDKDLTDTERVGYERMPILLSDGSLNANRFGVAPTEFAVGVVFQDRTWLAVDTVGSRPNTLMYSEADEPEAIPEVNEIVLQTNLRDTDYITALIPYAGALIVAQSRHCHRLTYVNSPQNDATTSLVAYRGCLNQRCWDIYGGIAYLLDDNGFYSLDPQGSMEALSSGLDTMFRENTDSTLPKIDFSKRKWFFVRADTNQNVIRFHVSFKGDGGIFPSRQIVYSPEYKSAWIEEYPFSFSAGTQIRSGEGNVILVHGSDSGLHSLGVGLTDEGQPVNYSYKTGNFEFVTDGTSKTGGQQQSRQISVVYKPTTGDCRLNMSLFYNGGKKPRENVVRRDRGVGFIADDDVPAHYINLKLLAHQEAESNGVARAVLAGKTIEDFAGNDTHVALRFWGEQDEAGPVIIHSVDINGVSGGQE
jgi:hypothetical protein